MFDQTVPNRYLAPKWLAYVTTENEKFVFVNGLRVKSMWELKQALLVLPEEVIRHHVTEERNDIATWVKDVIGDKELAKGLQKQTHRWGLIVALERQMMRTVKLPGYVAQRWLAPAKAPFTFASGETAGSLEELVKALKKVSDEVVSFHKERQPNDIAVWVQDTIGDYELAEMVEEATGRWQMERYVDDHVAMLKEAA